MTHRSSVHRGQGRRLSVRGWLLVFGLLATAVVVAAGALQSRSYALFADPIPGAPGSADSLNGAIVAPSGDLSGVAVIANRPNSPAPYRRAAFGEAWTDDSSAPLGHNGCDTRNDILRRDLTRIAVVRTSRCPDAVKTGFLRDPYSGAQMNFVRGPKTSADVQIDHIVPLAYAWDLGAWKWDDATRTAFANDPRNLVAVSGPANENKRDSPPGRWMPSNERFHCQYVRQFATVLRIYRLPIERASAGVIREVWSRC